MIKIILMKSITNPNTFISYVEAVAAFFLANTYFRLFYRLNKPEEKYF